MLPLTNLHYIFLCPHPTAFGFNAQKLFGLWTINILLLALVTIGVFIYFYFRRKFDLKAIRRFWQAIIFLNIFAIVASMIFVLYEKGVMIGSNTTAEPNSLKLGVVSAVSGIGTELVLLILSFAIFKLVSIIFIKDKRFFPF